MNYLVADFIIRVKNASLARRRKIVVPYLRITKSIGSVLVKEGFLDQIKENTVEGKKMLEVSLRYDKRSPALTDVALVSKPSLRIYSDAKMLPEIHRRGRKTLVLSTNKGIMTGKEAFTKNIGGEVLFKIW